MPKPLPPLEIHCDEANSTDSIVITEPPRVGQAFYYTMLLMVTMACAALILNVSLLISLVNALRRKAITWKRYLIVMLLSCADLVMVSVVLAICVQVKGVHPCKHTYIQSNV